MLFQRRQLLRTLSLAFGSSCILQRNQPGLVAQTAVEPKPSPLPAGAAVHDGISGGTEKEKVTGIGGFFFRAKDSKALRSWYLQHLGISLTPSSYEDSVWQQEAGTHRFRSSTGVERAVQGNRQALDVELSSRGSRQNGSPATSGWNRSRG